MGTTLRQRAALSNPPTAQMCSEIFSFAAKRLWPKETARSWRKASGQSESAFYQKIAGDRRVTGDDWLVILRELAS